MTRYAGQYPTEKKIAAANCTIFPVVPSRTLSTRAHPARRKSGKFVKMTDWAGMPGGREPPPAMLATPNSLSHLTAGRNLPCLT